jgi:hypothetical protein
MGHIDRIAGLEEPGDSPQVSTEGLSSDGVDFKVGKLKEKKNDWSAKRVSGQQERRGGGVRTRSKKRVMKPARRSTLAQ